MTGSVLYIEKLAARLAQAGQTVSTAESCTGGLLGGRLTDWPGSSAYYLGGVISYANPIKQKLLGVRAETLERCGAVSGEAAREMAEGVRCLTGSDWSIAITGVAGPGGGTDLKPVGLVWIGIAGPAAAWTWESHFTGRRADVRRQAVERAIRLFAEKLSAKQKNA
jgi:PncC family amidohydrolase